MRTVKKFLAISVCLSVTAILSAFSVSAGSESLTVEYGDIWESESISAKSGETIRFLITVPEGTKLKGCGATVKIPGYEEWTDSNDKDQGHIALEVGENFIYELTPTENEDILFTCWMGSGCHKNYIHVSAAEEKSEYTLRNETAPESASTEVPQYSESDISTEDLSNTVVTENQVSKYSGNPRTGVGVNHAIWFFSIAGLLVIAAVLKKRKS